MSKPNWGIKRICPSCGMKYYDFHKSPIICPGCNFEFDPDLLLKSRKGRGFANKSDEPIENPVEDLSTESNEGLVPIEIENDEEILEINDQNELSTEDDIDKDIKKNLESELSHEQEDIPFIEDDLDEETSEVQDEQSIEVEDEDDKN